MTKEEAIKYLQQLYPNGGHCWLDEQRIDAIDIAVKSLKEEPVERSEEDEEIRKLLIKYHRSTIDINGVPGENIIAWLEKQGQKEPVGFYYVNSDGKKFYSDTFKYGDVILHVEKQDEQKPVECTDEPQHESSNDNKSDVFVETFERQQDIFKQQQDIFKQGKEELKNVESFVFSLEDKIGSYNSQDSELIEETYYIPDGYMAEIHENRVTIKKKSV